MNDTHQQCKTPTNKGTWDRYDKDQEIGVMQQQQQQQQQRPFGMGRCHNCQTKYLSHRIGNNRQIGRFVVG